MRAVCWHAARDIRVETVPDPTLLNPRDARLRDRDRFAGGRSAISARPRSSKGEKPVAGS